LYVSSWAEPRSADQTQPNGSVHCLALTRGADPAIEGIVESILGPVKVLVYRSTRYVRRLRSIALASAISADGSEGSASLTSRNIRLAPAWLRPSISLASSSRYDGLAGFRRSSVPPTKTISPEAGRWKIRA